MRIAQKISIGAAICAYAVACFYYVTWCHDLIIASGCRQVAINAEASGNSKLQKRAAIVGLRYSRSEYRLLSFLGSACLALKEYKQSENALTMAYMLMPYFPNVALNLGIVLFEQDKLAEAEYVLLGLIDTWPDYPKALHNLSVVYRKMGELVKAEQHVRRALALAPGNAKARLSLALVLRDKGDPDWINEVAMAIELDPGILDGMKPEDEGEIGNGAENRNGGMDRN